MLTSKQRAALRSAANTLEPVFLIGKEEIGEAMIAAIESCIANRELIKVKCLETAEYSAKEAADILAPALNAECVQVIGRKFVLFRQKTKDSAFEELLNPTLAAKKKATAKKVTAKPAARTASKTAYRGRTDFARGGEHGRTGRFGAEKRFGGDSRFGHGPRFGSENRRSNQSRPSRFGKKQG